MGIDVVQQAQMFGRRGSTGGGAPMLAMGINLEAIDQLFAGIDGATKAALRPATAAAARVIRDKAKDNVRSLGSRTGQEILYNAMYMKFSKEKSRFDYRKEYHVSYNTKKAPHGHFLEMGHLQPYLVRWNPIKNRFYTVIRPDKLKEALLKFKRDPEGRLQVPKGLAGEYYVRHPFPVWIAPRPFLRNALISARGAAMSAAKDKLLDGLQNRVQNVNGKNYYTLPMAEPFKNRKDY